MTTPDPVDQARSWLAGQTGGQIPGVPAADRWGAAEPTGLEPDPKRGRARSHRGRSRPSRASIGTADDPADRPVDDATDRPEVHPADDPSDADADPVAAARTIALRKLTAQARTRQELDRALHRKDVPDEVAATVLDRLEEVGLVDDEAFAHDWVESRQQRRHLSRSALRRELQAKGVDRDHVDAALATVGGDDELEAARALVAKKARASHGLDPAVRRRRLAGALARRGFGSGIIATVLGELPEEGADEAGD